MIEREVGDRERDGDYGDNDPPPFFFPYTIVFTFSFYNNDSYHDIYTISMYMAIIALCDFTYLLVYNMFTHIHTRTCP